MSIISKSEAKAHVNASDYDYDDDLIMGMVATALEAVSKFTHRQLEQETRVETFDGFPQSTGYLKLKYVPYVSLTDIKYLDADGVEQTLASSVYRVDTRKEVYARVYEAYNQYWPTTRDGAETVTVTYVAGYDTLPDGLRLAALMMLAAWYENRGDGFMDKDQSPPLPPSAQALMAPFVVHY